MIHVCYAIHDKDGRYSKFTATSMLSLFENTPPPVSVTIHILHDNTLTLENRDKFNQIAGRYGQIVKFYNVEILCSDIISRMKNLFAEQLKTSAFTVAMFYRLFVTELISSEINKIIYLDSDTIVHLNIRELWQIEIGEKLLAAVTEKDNLVSIECLPICIDGFVNYEKYFNSGVLILNLKMLRNERKLIEKGINFIAKNPKYLWCDQDILNYCFSENCFRLPSKFNQFVESERYIDKNIVEEKIYHYNSNTLTFDFLDNFNKLWFEYFKKTPYFNEDAFNVLCHITQKFQQLLKLYTQQKEFTQQISKTLSGKERGFFLYQNGSESIFKLFRIDASEEVIFAVDINSVKNMMVSLRLSKGKKIFLIFIDEFSAICELLTKAGFTFGKDFLNGMDLLYSESDYEAMEFNTRELLKLL